MPDWLKESSKEWNTNKQKSKEPEVPDWLKWVSLEKEVIQEPEIKEVSEINSLQKEEEWVKKPQKKLKEKQPENLVSQNEKSENKKPKAQKPAQTKAKTEDSNANKANDELWSDWMVIPDWLKTDDSKK